MCFYTLHTAHFTQCTLLAEYTVNSTRCEQCIFYRVQSCTLYSVQCTLHCTVYSVSCTVHCTVYHVHYTVQDSLQCRVQSGIDGRCDGPGVFLITAQSSLDPTVGLPSFAPTLSRTDKNKHVRPSTVSDRQERTCPPQHCLGQTRTNMSAPALSRTDKNKYVRPHCLGQTRTNMSAPTLGRSDTTVSLSHSCLHSLPALVGTLPSNKSFYSFHPSSLTGLGYQAV